MFEKYVPNTFFEKSRFAHFGQKLSKIKKLAIWLDVCNSLFKAWEYLKNLKVVVFETDFKQVPFVLRQTTYTYSESWGPVQNSFLQLCSSELSDFWN